MSTTPKAATNGLARLIVWVAFVISIIGGIATRDTGYGHWVSKQVAHGNTWWLPLGTFILAFGALTWSLLDKSPDLVSMIAVLSIPAIPNGYRDGAIGDWINWPIDFLYGLLKDNVGWLFGKGADISGFAGLCWFIALTVGGVALVRYLRARFGKGGRKPGEGPVPVSGNLQGVLAAARKGAK